MDKKPLIIGIAGRSRSGKTRLAKNLLKVLGEDKARHINVDKFWVYSANFNCEKPGELEHEAIKELKVGLSLLKEGKQAEFPIYDFKEYVKKKDKLPIPCSSAQTILVDGTLTFWNGDIRDLVDIKIFIDAPDAICLERKLEDYLPKEKGTEKYKNNKRAYEKRWEETVAPQWDKHLEPTKEHADITIPYHTDIVNVVDTVLAYLSIWRR